MRKIMVWNILVIMTDIGGHGMIVSIIIAYMAIMVDSIFIIPKIRNYHPIHD